MASQGTAAGDECNRAVEDKETGRGGGGGECKREQCAAGGEENGGVIAGGGSEMEGITRDQLMRQFERVAAAGGGEEMLRGAADTCNRLVLDESRRTFLYTFSSSLAKILSAPNGHPLNRYRLLLLGIRGIGKTAILKLIRRGIQCAPQLEDRVVVVYIDCLQERPLPAIPVLLWEHILAHIKAHPNGPGQHMLASTYQPNPLMWRSQTGALTAVTDVLRDAHMWAVLLVDELDQAYKRVNYEHEGTLSFLCQLASVGSDSSNRLHAVLSGSSTQLRRLAFRKPLFEPKRNTYPCAHMVPNLNSTKFIPFSLTPFQTLPHFQAICEHLGKPATASSFIASNGVPGALVSIESQDFKGHLSSLGYSPLTTDAEWDLLTVLSEALLNRLPNLPPGSESDEAGIPLQFDANPPSCPSAVRSSPSSPSLPASFFRLVDCFLPE